jgi:hypothetical protein
MLRGMASGAPESVGQFNFGISWGMAHQPTEQANSTQANSTQTDASDTLATPEGDNEFRPGEPLSPTEPIPERPRGDQPHSSEPLYPALD